MRIPTFVKLLSIALTAPLAAGDSSPLKRLPGALWTRSRRLLNFGSILGSATNSPSPYDRIAGHAVFSVTTSYGAPYMTMERLTEAKDIFEQQNSPQQKATVKGQAAADEQSTYRTCVLYFMDPDDALALKTDMSQMENMKKADFRITAFSLGRALRQSANFGQGLPTGNPADPLTGIMKTVQEGGSLRYKIVPAKRQLYYAARCHGKERVGLWGANPEEDALLALRGRAALDNQNIRRRQAKSDRRTAPNYTPMEYANRHMEGHSGIPVFYAPQLKRVQPIAKRIVSGSPHEIPLFFNYEDLEDAYKRVRSRNPKLSMPEKPENVEVFNLWDVLTSMDRDLFQKEQTERKEGKPWKSLLKPIRQRLPSQATPDLQHITFVPSSICSSFKEAATARGNGKARLRPMREM